MNAPGPAPQHPGKLKRAMTAGKIAWTAFTVLLGVVVGALTAASLWPEDMWPRNVQPQVFVPLSQTEPGDWVTPHEVKEMDAAPASVKGHSCSPELSAWLTSMKSIPTMNYVNFVLTTERTDSVVVLGVRTHVRKVDAPKMRTRVESCMPPGKGDFERRTLDIAVGPDQSTKTRIFREDGKESKSVGVNLAKGDAAEFDLQVSVDGSPGTVYEWTADLEILKGGEREYLPIPGGPRRVAGDLPDSAPQATLYFTG